MTRTRRIVTIAAAALILTLMAAVPLSVPDPYATIWALVPPAIAIALALITREDPGYVLKFKSLELLGQLQGLFDR